MPKSRKLTLEFANLHCTSGTKVLIDIADSLALPVLFSDEKRKYGKTSYFFMNQEYVTLEDGTPAIAFEFVKDTILRSEQVLELGSLRKRRKTLADSPSALVLLVLPTHRIVFLPKTAHAPTLNQLERTLEILLRKQRSKYVHQLRRKSTDPIRTQKELDDTLPPPDVRVMPLASAASIEAIFAKLKLVKTVRFEFFQTNEEYQPNGFFQQAEAQRKKMRAEKAVIEQRGGPKGLDAANARKEVAAATKQGTGRVVVKGKDQNDQDISQTDDDMQLRVPVNFSAESPAAAAPKMGEVLDAHVANGTLAKPKMDTPGLASKWRAKMGKFVAKLTSGQNEEIEE